MPDEKKRTFDDDDLFERRAYAAFLKNLILNCDNYHRDDDIKAYTIALDSPWGTGKSVFLEKFEAMLEQDCHGQLRVVHYNAWQNDFWDNAFEPFADAVFSHPLFASPLADQTEGSTGKKFGDALKHLALAFAKKRLDDYFDSPEMVKALEAAMSAAGTATSQNPTIISSKYSAYKMSLQTIQEAMETVLAENDSENPSKTVKLVIIIDELDRCRPTFAIETLEIVKHVMDISNVVFLFALDVQQLGASIKKVYGKGTDATGYLMRFFSYYSRMPNSNVEPYVQKIINETHKLESVKSEFIQAAMLLQLTARDLETVGKVYKIMIDQFLDKYSSLQAYKLYWTILCLKYKHPIEFDQKMKGDVSTEEKNYGVYFAKNSSKLGLLTPLRAATKSSTLEAFDFNYLSNLSQKELHIGHIVRIEPSCNNEAIRIQTDITSLSISKDDSLSGFLFYPDLLRWDEIKKLTPGCFLLQKMEMFNFLPDIK